MTTLLQRGFGLLNRGMQAAAAESVRYIRGATVISDALPATLAAPQMELITEGGAAVIGRQFVWRLKAADLVIGGELVAPQAVDRIEWDHDGIIYRFEVVQTLTDSSSPNVDPRSDWVPANVILIETEQA